MVSKSDFAVSYDEAIHLYCRAKFISNHEKALHFSFSHAHVTLWAEHYHYGQQ